MHTRPFESGGAPAWLYIQNVLLYGQVARVREGSMLYVDTADGASPNQRGRALVAHRDERGYPLVFTLRDSLDVVALPIFSLRTYCGVNEVGAAVTVSTSGIGFPTVAAFPEAVLVARPGDVLRVIGVDDGGEIFFEDVPAFDRDNDPLEVDFDDDGPYLRLAPRGHLVHVFQERAWVSDGTDTFWWCNGFGDYEAWPAANNRTIGGKPQGIRAISSLGDFLVLGRYQDFIIGHGDPRDGGANFSTEPVRANGRGTTSPRSFVEIEGRLWFLSQTGEICAFDGARAEPITRPVQDYLRPHTPLMLDPEGFPRPDTSAFADATAVWYQPWNAYVVMFEGETPGVWDLGIAVNVDTGQASVLTGFDAQAMAVKSGDEGSLLTMDRFGVVYIQDRGFVDTRTAEGASPPYTHTFPVGVIQARAIPHPSMLGEFPKRGAARLRIMFEHMHQLDPVVRFVADTIGLRGFYRAEHQKPSLLAQATALPAQEVSVGYFAGSIPADNEDPEAFIIGTHPVQPDGWIASRIGVSGFAGRALQAVVTNGSLADGERLAAAANTPPATGEVGSSVSTVPIGIPPETFSVAAMEWEADEAGPD